MSSYAFAKLVGTLWIGQLARDHPNLYFAAVSPGMTHSTGINEAAPSMVKSALPVLMPMMKLTQQAHAPDVGAKRYLDVLLGASTPQEATEYKSGAFVASAWFATGSVCDQADSYPDLFSNEKLQEAAAAAVRQAIRP